MCQSKAQGGKRCANGMLGSRATINTAVQILRQKPEDVKEVFTSLRQEGKSLPAPTQEQIEAFAAQQKFQARWNSELPPAVAERIANQWDEAVNEEPDGGTFHAWKNTFGEVARRARAKLAAMTAITGLSMALASCSGGGTLANTTPDPSIAPSTPAVTQSADPSSNAALGIDVGTARTDQFGDYNQVALSDDAPVLAYDASKYDDVSKTAYTEEQLADGQEQTARFVAEYIMDNPALYDQSADNLEAYKAETSGFVSDQYVAEWQSDVMAGNNGYATDALAGKLVVSNPGAIPDGYTTGDSRYSMDKFEMSSGSFAPADGAVVYEYSVDYTRAFTAPDERAEVRFTGIYRIGVVPSADGTWKMVGWSQDIHAEKVAE